MRGLIFSDETSDTVGRGSRLKAKMLLADAATAHPDGTFSMLRAGINVAWSPAIPIPLRAVLVIRIEGDMGDHGTHNFDLRCMNQDGIDATPRLEGSFDIGPQGGTSNLILALGTAFPEFGTYRFVVRIDNVQADEWTINAVKQEKPS